MFSNVALKLLLMKIIAKYLSGTPEARNFTVSFQYIRHLYFLIFLHALKIKVAKITSNIFFKFLLNIIFSGFVFGLFQIIEYYSSVFAPNIKLF